ncbi:hypothetical protein EH223_08125 [candidate division KSB1 bacterium]|nr:glycosyltransferase family 39 protein [candidate division KSB1 bacterium]RQW04159.1 MAG: hypothetical protein EH223_08125 [candidate division KSB1 bacterium]
MKVVDYFSQNMWPDRKTIFSAILIVSLGIRLGFILLLKPNGFYLGDTRHYDAAARHLLAGEGFGEKYSRSPAYPVFMALIYWSFGRSFLAVRFIESLLGLVLVVTIYFIANKAFNETVAVLSAALASLFPHFIILTGLLYSTNLFTVLLAGSIYFMLKSEENNDLRYLILSSVCAGLATLTIPSMFFILPLWLFWLVLSRQHTKQVNLFRTLLFSFIIAAMLTPWTVLNHQKYNRLILVRPLTHTSFPNLADLDAQNERIKNGFSETTEYLKTHPNGSEADKISHILGNYVKHPLQAVKYMMSEIIHFWALYPDRLDTPSRALQKKISIEDFRYVSLPNGVWKMVTIISIIVLLPIFLFAIPGVVLSCPLDRKKGLLLLTIVGMSVGYSLVYAEVRYRIPIEPYVLMFTAVGLVRCFEFFRFVTKSRELK